MYFAPTKTDMIIWVRWAENDIDLYADDLVILMICWTMKYQMANKLSYSYVYLIWPKKKPLDNMFEDQCF
jgi:hypothetical protein